MTHAHHFVYPPQGSVAPDERGIILGICSECGCEQKGFASFEAWTENKKYGKDYGNLHGEPTDSTQGVFITYQPKRKRGRRDQQGFTRRARAR